MENFLQFGQLEARRDQSDDLIRPKKKLLFRLFDEKGLVLLESHVLSLCKLKLFLIHVKLGWIVLQVR